MNKQDLTGKAIVFLADGMADDPLAELNGMSPLEAVETPYMDSIAKNGVKVLGEGELTKNLTVKAAVFSASAKEKIEAVGGKTEVV